MSIARVLSLFLRNCAIIDLRDQKALYPELRRAAGSSGEIRKNGRKLHIKFRAK